ncbi:MAG: DUF5672 family protein [Sphingobium sp.]|nr:DUF5672 family protein [Sphingobium sp.]
MEGGSSSRLSLPQVTLCAVSCVNVAATIRAMERSLAQIDFAAARLLTDAPLPPHPAIEILPIPRISSSRAYSDFILRDLLDYIDTSHCLIVQWDGHVIDATRWTPDFLNQDYIGARWPQVSDDYNVGNGGFSLRSRRLMHLCRDPAFWRQHPEDVAIGRINRPWLEEQGLSFATPALADLFSTERAGDLSCSFGYHGAWLMPQAIGVPAFWALYPGLDDRSTIRHDFPAILKQIGRGRGGWARAARLIRDRIFFREGR